jgi:hypothetical protein
MTRKPKSNEADELSKSFSIDLTGAEAIVLFEFLARCNENEKYSIEDKSEQRVLWDIECILEKSLVAPLSKHYAKILRQARSKVKNQ